MEQKWIPITDRLPDSGKYVLLSFENFSLPVVGRYEVSENNDGAFYVGDDFETCSEQLQKIPDRLKRDVCTYNIAVRFGMVQENREPIKFYFEKVGETDGN